MDIALVGEGPAANAVEAALSDVDVNLLPVDVDLLDGFDLAVVVDTAGADGFQRASTEVDRVVTVEVGGVGGHALDDVDASVSILERTCYDCLRQRVAASNPDTANRPAGVRSAVRYAGAVAGRRTVRLLSGDAIGDTVVEVPGAEREILPVPNCACASNRDRTLDREFHEVDLEAALERGERAVDRRVGLLPEVGERESFPVPYYIASSCDTTGFSDAQAAEFAAGVSLDWNAAFMKAIGEGLERYAAGTYRSDRALTGTPEDVPNPVTPDEFVTPEPVDVAGESIAWVPGEHVASGEQASLPAAFVRFPPAESRFRPSITTGLGLGNSGGEALLAGLYETVERDASMLAWYSTFDPLELTVDDPEFAQLEKRASAEGLEVTALLVTVDVDVPVVAVGVHREGEWPRFAAGSDADLDPVAAARAALAEALQNWMELRAMGKEEATQQGAAIGHHADFPAETRRFFDPDVAVDTDGVGEPDVTGEDELDALLDRLAAADLDAHAARTTTRDLETLGFEAVRALVPAAQPLFTGDPYFGARARNVPETLGFEPDLDREYHPFP
jgi:ribosomal protein S12 methylthiotransferase accessory factor